MRVKFHNATSLLIGVRMVSIAPNEVIEIPDDIAEGLIQRGRAIRIDAPINPSNASKLEPIKKAPKRVL